jgi:MFS family permease
MVITMRQFLKDREAAPGYGAAEGTQAAAGDSPVCSGGIYLPGLVAVNLVTFVLLFALEGFSSTIIPLLGSLTLGLSADKLGIILAAGVVMRFVVGLAAGMLSDRYGRTRVLVPCLVTAGVGIMAVLYATNWWIFLAAVLIFSIGRMGNNIPLALLGDLTHPSRIGWMTAVNRFVADSGLALGPLVLGTIADKRGFETAGAFAVAVSWLATLVLWYVFKKRPQEKYAAD